MNLENVIAMHLNWKERLKNYILGTEKGFNVHHVERDDKCELGNWIYGEGMVNRDNGDFQKLKLEHAKFHKSVAEIIKIIDKGETQIAIDLINDPNSEFNKLSDIIVSQIRELDIML